MSRTILKLEAISAKTGVPIATLRFYRSQSTGPKMFRLGGRVVAFEDDVEAWVMAQYDASTQAS